MIKTIFVSILATLFLAGTLATLTGCSTVVGGGKEMEQGGKAVKDEANENK
jgi:predicted small secreted protein